MTFERTTTESRQYRIGFVMEQTLGHVTHGLNLRRAIETDPSVCPVWLPIGYDGEDRWERVPGVKNNWSLKGSLRAKDALAKVLSKGEKLDALFIHTQTLALFAVPLMKRVPTIVSLDATPINYDTVAVEYGHAPTQKNWLEQKKFGWNRKTFHAAQGLITWCDWAKHSLIADYGVDKQKITTIPPGIDLKRWDFGAKPRSADPAKPLRLLFVGGDFVRKGGNVLLSAFRNDLRHTCVLDIVTKSEASDVEAQIEGLENVNVYRGLNADSPKLRELYANADVFVFPTLGDCLPIAVMEAMAAGLPIVTTHVGALSEEVEDGVNGTVIPPRNAEALQNAVNTLRQNPEQRLGMGLASRQRAQDRFDAETNYAAILTRLKELCQ